MLIKETSVFTKRVERLLDMESYRLLQLRLVADPKAGVVIPRTGGLRKIRWRLSGGGKRAGVRVVYYWAGTQNTVLMLMIFAKNEQANLTAQQAAILRRIVEEEYK